VGQARDAAFAFQNAKHGAQGVWRGVEMRGYAGQGGVAPT